MKNILTLITDNYSIQEQVFENCIIPAGTYLEIYCNPDGLHDEDSSNGFSIFIEVDKEISYFDIINNSDMLDSCSVKNDEVRIDIITSDDEFNRLNECTFYKSSMYL